jgi:hypothetical protein
MANRYQDKPFSADDDFDRIGEPHTSAKGESDPLAELARLIGQTDPFGTMGRANLPLQPRSAEHDFGAQRDFGEQDELPAATDDAPAAGPPSWMQRARQEAPPPDYPSAVHPLHRYAPPHSPASEPDDHFAPPPFAAAEQGHEIDPSRYDDALYGPLETDPQGHQHDHLFENEPYAYNDDYSDGAEALTPKRRGRMATVAAVLALGVLGTGGALAYRTYIGSPRSGEPPIIRADAGPTKVIPAPADGSVKVPDRMASGDNAEKIVPREEAPVDLSVKSNPRVVFPPTNQGMPPLTTSAASTVAPANAVNGTLANGEPRKIKTFSVRGDQPDSAAAPVTAAPAAAKPTSARATASPSPAPSAARTPASAANANASSAPLSLSPQANQSAPAEPRTRVAATTPVQIAPQAAPSGAAGGGNYLVQVSSQRNEADAQASYRALQGKFPSVLGSRSPMIKRADLGEKGVYYRAMVGPFGSPDEASQFCGSLRSAGGQCVVQRN